MRVETFCYLPSLKGPFLPHLQRFKRALPLHILTDGPVNEVARATVTKLPTLGPFTTAVHTCQPSDQYAYWAFVHVIDQARKLDLDYFLLVENDCRFSRDNWDAQMLSDFQSWPRDAKPLFGGTPVCWHPWARGHHFAQLLIDYAYHYQVASGVAMAFEGSHTSQWGTALYPNGALAIYNVAELCEYFAHSLELLKTNDPRAMAQRAIDDHAFDLHIGRKFIAKHGEAVLDKLAYIPSVYSGCKDHHVTLGQRLAMLSGPKVAVHHIKTSEHPWS